MIYIVASIACGLLVPSAPTVQYVMPAAASYAQPVSLGQRLLFPTTDMLAATTTVTSFDDELEKIAEQQRAQDAKIDAQVSPLVLLTSP